MKNINKKFIIVLFFINDPRALIPISWKRDPARIEILSKKKEVQTFPSLLPLFFCFFTDTTDRVYYFKACSSTYPLNNIISVVDRFH